MLEAKGLCKSYISVAGRQDVLQDVNFFIEHSMVTSITGPSGSGKSTLLRIMGGLAKPDRGIVIVANERIDNLNQASISNFLAQKIGFVFQQFHLINFLTVEQNVALALGVLGVAKPEQKKLIGLALEMVGLSDKANVLPSHLSGGEQQRVAIARGIVKRPAVLLCDEPTGSLNESTACSIFELITRMAKDLKCAVVMVTHNESLAHKSDVRYNLNRGTLLKGFDLSRTGELS